MSSREVLVDLASPAGRFLGDHVVLGWTALPAAFALREALVDAAGRTVRDLEMPGLVGLDEDAPLRLRASTGDDGGWSLAGPDGTVASGQLAGAEDLGPADDLDAVRARCTTSLDGPAFYAALERLGARLGPAFQGLGEVRLGPDEALGTLPAPGAGGAPPPPVAVLDACAQVCLAAAGLDRRSLPVAVGAARGRPDLVPPLLSHAVVRDPGSPTLVDLRVQRPDGTSVLELDGVVLRGGRRRG